MAEGVRWFNWLNAERLVNRSICTQVHERCYFKRMTVDSQRSCIMQYPYLGVGGMLHIEDVAPTVVGEDPAGIASRCIYATCPPRFLRHSVIANANDEYQRIHHACPEEHLAKRFLQVRLAHRTEFAGLQHFVFHKGYPFRVHTLETAEAMTFFCKRWDLHCDQQPESWCTEHEASKRQGKLKSKHARLIPSVANVLFVHGGKHFQDLNTTHGLIPVKIAYLLGEYTELVFAKFTRFLKNLLANDMPPKDPTCLQAAGSSNLRARPTLGSVEEAANAEEAANERR